MERFTQRARRVLSLAHQEAERARNNFIGTEHLLIGLMDEEGGVAGRTLRELGLTTERVREMVKRVSVISDNFDSSRVELAADTQQVLEYSVEEARRLGHHYFGTEHIMLGLMRVESTAMDVLSRLGVNADQVRRQTRQVLNETASSGGKQQASHIYIWYGSKLEFKDIAKNFVEKIGFIPVFIDEMDNASTFIQKLDRIFPQVKFAIIFVPLDDLGFGKESIMEDDLISSQNSVYQSGFFHAKLGMKNVCILSEENLHEKAKMLFNSLGIGYILMDRSDNWKSSLAIRMMIAGLNVDTRKIL